MNCLDVHRVCGKCYHFAGVCVSKTDDLEKERGVKVICGWWGENLDKEYLIPDVLPPQECKFRLEWIVDSNCVKEAISKSQF